MNGDRFMDILDQKTDDELLRSLLAEVAKTNSSAPSKI